MNITDQQLREIALAGGIDNANTLSIERSDNFFELKDNEQNSVFSLQFIIGACSDRVEFKSNVDSFDEEASRRKMENLGLIERL